MAQVAYPLSLEEQAETGFTHKAIIKAADVAALGASTTGAIAIYPYVNGIVFRDAATKLVSGFVGESVTNLTIEVGWNGASTDDPNGLIEATELATAGTEVLYQLGNGVAFATKVTGYAPLDAGNIEAAFTSTGANLSVITAGEVHVYLTAYDMSKV